MQRGRLAGCSLSATTDMDFRKALAHADGFAMLARSETGLSCRQRNARDHQPSARLPPPSDLRTADRQGVFGERFNRAFSGIGPRSGKLMTK